jgi:dTDP-L-rhamnose 4-epimerase
MAHKVLIVGGGGFIGSYVADLLLEQGDDVRILDPLLAQVHGDVERPSYLARDTELLRGDVRDPDQVSRAVRGVDHVVHLAARVGVGQSMYEVAEYTSVNAVGTAVLLEALADNPVQRLVVASSMSVYGEGLYRDRDGNTVDDVERTRRDLEAGRWEPLSDLGEPLAAIPTPETKAPRLSSVYALGKYDQEQLCLLMGKAYRIPTIALRFFNVYGPRQALSNPYTGVLAIFASRLLNGRPPLVFEDGGQRRDFVSVHDVARACVLALSCNGAADDVFNIGSGESVTVDSIANRLARILGRPEIEPVFTGTYRVGDIRHCFADITKAAACLGYRPSVSLDDGLAELATWLEGQTPVDHVETAAAELAARGLTV